MRLHNRLAPSESASTVTDTAGRYVFGRLATGEYLIEVEAAGFARIAVNTTVPGGRQVAELDVVLDVAQVREEVTVTSSGTAQSVDEVSKALTVLDGGEIEARGERSIPEALRTIPGLRVRQLGGPGTLTSIRSRGLRNQDTAVLIDGLRLRDVSTPQADASILLGTMTVTDLSRVEVLRGSGSSLYGTNAVGGVLNVVTDEGGGPLRGSLLTEGGSLGLFRGRAQFAGGAGEGDRLTFSAGLSHLNVSRGVDGDDANRNTGGQGKAVFRLTPTASLSARLYAANSFVQLNESPSPAVAAPPSGVVEAMQLAPGELRRYETGTPLSQLNVGGATFIPSANDPDASGVTRFFSGAVTFTHRPSENLSYAVTYHALTSGRTDRDGPAGVSPFEPRGSARLENVGRVHTLYARSDFRVGRAHLVTAAYELEGERFTNRAFPVSTAGNSVTGGGQRSHAFFVQDQVRLFGGRLQLSGAFRAQLFALRQPEFSPAANPPYRGSFEAPPNAYTGDASAGYYFRKNGTKLRGHVGNGYRAPSQFERFGTLFSSFTGMFTPIGDPRLKPERSLAFDAGADQELFGGRLRASATYFYTRLQEVIDFDSSGRIRPETDPFGRFFGYFNTGGGLARGIEMSATTSPTAGLELFASYTYTNSDERVPHAGGIRSFVIPGHQFSLVATQRLGGRAVINFDLVTSSDYLAPIFPAVYRFGGMVKADVVFSYGWPLADSRSLRLFAKAENLFDRDYYEGGFRTPPRGVTAGITLFF